MQDYSQGKIFLSAERGLTETDWFRSYCTFNCNSFQQQNKAAYGPLYVLNDETLAAGRATNILITEDSVIILLPVVGAVVYEYNQHHGAVNAGEAIIISVTKGDQIQLSNPFETELVNYLQIGFKVKKGIILKPETFLFDIDSSKNVLLPLFAIQCPTQGFFIKSFIGKFTGRQEAIYKISQPGNGIFVYVLQGAFEMQYRLLENRDGLALWNADEIELEALSNDAIIWLVEMPLA